MKAVRHVLQARGFPFFFFVDLSKKKGTFVGFSI